MKSFSVFITKNAAFILPIFVIAGVFSIYFLLDLKKDNSLEAMLPEDDSAILFNNIVQKNFGTDEPFIIAWNADESETDIFTQKQLKKIKTLCEEFKKIDEIDWVASLTETDTIFGEDEDVIIEPLFNPKKPIDATLLQKAKERSKADPFLTGTVISKDLKTTAITLGVKKSKRDDPEMRMRLADKVNRVLDNAGGGNENYYLAGVAPIQKQYVVFMNHDLTVFYPIIVFVLALMMLYSFRSFFGILLPLITVFLTALCTMGFYAYMGKTLNSVTMMLPPLLMVIVISSSVHYLSHARHILPERKDRREGLLETSSIIGAPILLNCITSAIGFASLSVSRIMPVRNFGIYAAFGIMLAFFTTMTVIPEALRLNKWASAHSNEKKRTIRPPLLFTALLNFCSHIVSHHRRKVLAASLILAALSFYFILQIKVETNVIKYFPEDSRIPTDIHHIEDRLTGIIPLDVIVDTGKKDGAFNPEVLAQLGEMETFLKKQPSLYAPTSINTYFKKIKSILHNESALPQTREEAAQYTLLAEVSGGKDGIANYIDDERRTLRVSSRQRYIGSKELADLVKRVDIERGRIFGKDIIPVESTEESKPKKLLSRVTGVAALYSNMVDTLVDGQLKGFGLALLVISIIMIVMLGSFKYGLLSMVPNVIPVMMTAGGMGLLGIELNTATAMIAGVAIGIAVDDTIHFMTFFRQFSSEEQSAKEAVKKTINTSGVAMATTSLILLMGFSALATSGFVPIGNFGILSAITMVSALFGDLILLPALLITFSKKA